MKKGLICLIMSAAVFSSAFINAYTAPPEAAEADAVRPAGDIEEKITREAAEAPEGDFRVIPDGVSLFSSGVLRQDGGDYAYRDFLKRSHPDGRRALYNDLLELCRAFLDSSQSIPPETVTYADGSSDTVYTLGKLDITGYDLDRTEAIEVYYMFRYDHPEYYWLSNMIITGYRSYGSSMTRYMQVSVYDEYADYSARARLDSAIEKTAESILSGIDTSDSIYNISRAIHDKIIAMVDYGYDSSHQPLDTTYAHTIIAVMDGDNSTMPVCEGYAKSYQLLLNYLGIENIVITGDAGGGHMWNAVQLENGNYYQVDVTWDDQPHLPGGIIYKYFMSPASNWAERSYDSPQGTEQYFLYELPPFPAEGITAEIAPTARPTNTPTQRPTNTPTAKPTNTPTAKPTNTPTQRPTSTPTAKPTNTPTVKPTSTPTTKPTSTPTQRPTNTPTTKPTSTPTTKPTSMPTVEPTSTPPLFTPEPTDIPTPSPTEAPVSDIEITDAYRDLVSVENITVSEAEGTTLFIVQNLGDIDLSGVRLIIAEYDGNGLLTGVHFELSRFSDLSTLALLGDISTAEHYKYMIWDENHTPLIKAITALKL